MIDFNGDEKNNISCIKNPTKHSSKTRPLHEILTWLVIIKNAFSCVFSNNQSCQYFMGWTYLNAKNLAPFLPPTLWESKMFLGGFWHLSQLKFEEISPKLQRMQILRKLAPWESKLFWEVSHLSQLMFEEISPKIPRMQILRKLPPPPWPTFTRPPGS